MAKSIARRAGLAAAALMVTVSAAAAAAPANAAEGGDSVLGGWAESTGSFVSGSSLTGAPTIGTFATPNHRGASESKTISGTSNKRAHGWTTWAGTKHYTTAQLEHYWPASGVIASSGRKWGVGGTEAISPWKAFNPNATSNGNGQPRTYYGR
jgi:hypothetical protein